MKKLIILLALVPLFCAAQKTKTENVFIITLDGFRWQEFFGGADSLLINEKKYTKNPDELKKLYWAATPEERRGRLLPFFWSTFVREGQLYGNRKHGNNVNCSNGMWFSYPGYNEILTGKPDDERINSNDKFENPNVTVLEYLNGLPAYKGKVAAFGSWDVFPYIINERRSGVPVNAGFENAEGSNLSPRETFLNELQWQIPYPVPNVRHDAFTHHIAFEYIKKSTPRVLYISYGETDDFAHAGDYGAYLRSATQTDKFIESLWKWVQSHPIYKNTTTFIVTTDHGRGEVPLDNWRDHNRQVEGSDQIWIAAMGPDTDAKGEVKEAGQFYQKQVAESVAAFLGEKFGDTDSGSLVTQLLGKRVGRR